MKTGEGFCFEKEDNHQKQFVKFILPIDFEPNQKIFFR